MLFHLHLGRDAVKPPPTILRRTPAVRVYPALEAVVQQRLVHSRFNSALGSLKQSTQGLVDYLSYMIQKTW